MNLQQLKAKYATATTTAATATVNTQSVNVKATAGRAWDATKSATVSASDYVVGIAPATNRRVNSIAAELNAELNDQDFRIFKQEVIGEMIAQHVGMNLPDDARIREYYNDVKAQEAKAKAEAEAKESGEQNEDALATKIMQYVTEAFRKNGYAPKEEEVKSDLAPEVQEHIKKKIEEAPADDEEEVVEVEEVPVTAGATKKSRREAAEAKAGGRRKLGRQAPITNEEE